MCRLAASDAMSMAFSEGKTGDEDSSRDSGAYSG